MLSSYLVSNYERLNAGSGTNCFDRARVSDNRVTVVWGLEPQLPQGLGLLNYNSIPARIYPCMDREHISGLVHRLNDIELAVLLCLVADRHCILSTERNYLRLLQRQLELVS